ncbi:MAG TPA: DUF2950 domain-containing protein [Chthoniobacterales bacterium]|nr:DUF2950 domain-containing protein [Chthoniobacterales bacterium]
MISSRITLLACAAFVLCVPMLALEAAPEAEQKGFEDSKNAAEELIKACETFDVPALASILGPGSEDLISSEDAVQDKSRATAFAAKAREKNSVEMDKKDANRAILSIGNEEWPLPIPLIKRKGKWYFDTKAGRDEILHRRIGANELNVIQICRGFVEAEEEYALVKHDDSTVNQYAQRIISTPGKHDGLAWQNPDGTWGGPIGEGVARALEEGYSDKSKPFHGYYFKVLKGQGPAAPLGEMDFLVNGAMIGGFALAAAPAEYGVTGVQTFMVSHTGIVYQQDLGPETLKTFQSMERFNPDKTWNATDDQWPEEKEVAAQ